MGDRSPAYEAELRLTEDYASGQLARQFTSETLAALGYQGRHEDVILVASELVGNALRHGRGAPVLRLVGTPSRVRIEVSDHSPALPAMREPGLPEPGLPEPGLAEGGWGLLLVQVLGTGWGASPRNGGKVVWCEMSTGCELAGMPPATGAVAATNGVPMVGVAGGTAVPGTTAATGLAAGIPLAFSADAA